MPFAVAMGAAALGTGIYGAVSSSAASSAEQKQEENYLNQVEGQMGVNQANLQPYMNLGSAASSAYQAALPSLTQGFDPTVAQLQATPGYQFEQTQGTNNVDNQMAAQGLSGSGAEMSGLDQYTTGLANQTYSSLADIYNQNRQTTEGVLSNATGIGNSAADEYGQISSGLTGQEGSAYGAIGQAQAGGIMGTANSLTGMMSGLAGTMAMPTSSTGTVGGALSNYLMGSSTPTDNLPAIPSTSSSMGTYGPVNSMAPI